MDPDDCDRGSGVGGLGGGVGAGVSGGGGDVGVGGRCHSTGGSS